MKSAPLILLAVFLFTSCSQVSDGSRKSLSVSARPIQGTYITDKGKTRIQSSHALQMRDYFVWGGSVTRGKDGRYHMLFSLWECGESWAPFQDGWLLNSKIAYAVSDHPDREFEFQKIVLRGRLFDGDSTAWDAQSVHNPHIKLFNGKYYLYYTGSRDPGPQLPDSPGGKLTKRNRIQQSQKLGVIELDSFEDLASGNFQRPDHPLLTPRTRVKADNVVDPSPPGTIPKPDNMIVVNPSVTYRPADGKYLLYFKGNLWDPGWRGVHGVAVSDSPTGPFTALDDFVFDIRTEDGRIASAEDPYVWFHRGHNFFYAVIKDFSGRITGSKPGLALMKSEDGIDWEIAENPLFMKKELKFKAESVLKVSHLERPQLLTDTAGNPAVLYAACSVKSVGGKRDGTTFNIHIPIVISR